jgi:hypothetical protein
MGCLGVSTRGTGGGLAGAGQSARAASVAFAYPDDGDAAGEEAEAAPRAETSDALRRILVAVVQRKDGRRLDCRFVAVRALVLARLSGVEHRGVREMARMLRVSPASIVKVEAEMRREFGLGRRCESAPACR